MQTILDRFSDFLADLFKLILETVRVAIHCLFESDTE